MTTLAHRIDGAQRDRRVRDHLRQTAITLAMMLDRDDGLVLTDTERYYLIALIRGDLARAAEATLNEPEEKIQRALSYLARYRAINAARAEVTRC